MSLVDISQVAEQQQSENEQPVSEVATESFDAKFNELVAKYDQEAMTYEFVQALHRETGMSPSKMSACVAFVCLLLYATGCGLAGLTNVISFAYPTYASMKSLQSSNIEDERAWLIYWIIFASLSLSEQIFWFLFNYIPYYPAVKMALLGLCFHPRVQLAKKLHQSYLDPFLKKYGATIDQGVNAVSRVMNPLLDTVFEAQSASATQEEYDSGMVVDVSKMSINGEDILNSVSKIRKLE